MSKNKNENAEEKQNDITLNVLRKLIKNGNLSDDELGKISESLKDFSLLVHQLISRNEVHKK